MLINQNTTNATSASTYKIISPTAAAVFATIQHVPDTHTIRAESSGEPDSGSGPDVLLEPTEESGSGINDLTLVPVIAFIQGTDRTTDVRTNDLPEKRAATPPTAVTRTYSILPLATSVSQSSLSRRTQTSGPQDVTTKATSRMLLRNAPGTNFRTTPLVPYHVVVSPGQTRPYYLLPSPKILGLSEVTVVYIMNNQEAPLEEKLFIPKVFQDVTNSVSTKIVELFKRTQKDDIGPTALTTVSFLKTNTGFPSYWINRTQTRNNETEVWHKLSSDDNVSNTTLYGQYVRGVYNWTTNTLNVSGIVCGRIPSLFCLRAMIADALKAQRRNIDYTACDKNFTSPILYNLPRWLVCVRILPRQLISPQSFDPSTHRIMTANTFTLASLAVATLLLEDASVSEGCRLAMSPIRAIRHNLFYIRHPVNVTALLEKLPPDPDTHRHIDAQTFYDTTMLLSTAIYSGKDPDLLELHASSAALSNGTVLLDVGELQIPHLLRNNKSFHDMKPLINMSEVNHLDPIALDYLDGAAVDYAEASALDTQYVDEYYLAANIPVAPHTRRTGLIPLYGV